MAALRKIAILILGIAFLLYPLAMHSSLAAPSDYAGAVASMCHNDMKGPFPSGTNAGQEDQGRDIMNGHSGSMGNHSGNMADTGPCCPVSDNACATLVSSPPEVAQPAGPFVHEDERPAIMPENVQAPMPHPPKTPG